MKLSDVTFKREAARIVIFLIFPLLEGLVFGILWNLFARKHSIFAFPERFSAIREEVSAGKNFFTEGKK